MEIKASVVQYERNIRRDRLQRVADYKFKHYELTGNVPYGYDGVYEFADGYKVTTNHALSELELMPEVRIHGACRSKKLVDNLPEQQWIHTIHLWRFGGMKVPTNRSSLPPTGGMSLKQIANELNRRGVPTKLAAGRCSQSRAATCFQADNGVLATCKACSTAAIRNEY